MPRRTVPDDNALTGNRAQPVSQMEQEADGIFIIAGTFISTENRLRHYTMGLRSFWLEHSSMLLALVAVTIWGTGNLPIKLAAELAPPITLSGGRAFVGGIVLFAIIYARGERLTIPRKMLALVLLVAVLQVSLMPSFFYSGIGHTSLSAAAIIIGTVPIQVAMVEHFIASSERLTPAKLLGLIAGLTGLALVLWGDLQHEGLGSLAGNGRILISSILFTFSNLIVRHIGDRVRPLHLSALALLVGSLPALVVGFIIEEPQLASGGDHFWWLFLYIAVVVTAVPYVLWYRALRQDSAGRVSVFLFLVPVWGVFLGILILRERPNLTVVIGVTLVVLGIVQVARNSRAAAVPAGS